MAARFVSADNGRKVRLSKRVTGTAAAFTALAALTGSQMTSLGLAPVAAADSVTAPSGDSATPGVPGGPTIPGLGTGSPADGGGTVTLPQPPGAIPGVPGAGPFAATGATLPATVFAAYKQAEASIATRSPGCHLPWQLLAGIGQVESGQADGGQVDANGTTLRPILGPVLDGTGGNAAIPDTDGGRYDGDTRWDRAVGPMQFIPSTWATWGVDTQGKGKADPNNIFDAAEAAGRYLCANGRDLADPAQLDRAILSYNYSGEYLRTVKNWMAHFGSGTVTPSPDRPAPLLPLLPPLPPLPLFPPSGTGTGTTTGTGTGTDTGTTPVQPQPQPSPSPSAQPPTPVTPTPTATANPSPSPNPTGQPTPTTDPKPPTPVTPNPTATATPTPTATPTTPAPTPTGAPTACPSPTATATATPTGTPSPTATPSGTPSPTATPSGTPTPGATPTAPGCATATPGGTPTPSGAPSAAPTTTPSAGVSPSAAPSGH